MQVLFRSNKLKKNLTNDREMKKTYGVLARHISLRMNELINVFDTLEEIPDDPPQRMHKLTNYTVGNISPGIEYFSISVSGNYRIVFCAVPPEIPYGPSGEMLLAEVKAIEIVEVKDYHE